MNNYLQGIHHVTTMTGPPQPNVDFYTQVLGLRLIKVTVNFDDPTTYHLYYGDGRGTPGSAITFFPWPHLPPRRPGSGEIEVTAYTIPSGSLNWWRGHLQAAHVPQVTEFSRFGAPGLGFQDTSGSSIELIEGESNQTHFPWHTSPVSADHQIRGFHGATAWVRDAAPTVRLLTEVLGLEPLQQDANRTRYGLPDQRNGTHLDLVEDPSLPTAQPGRGSVHHLAWRVPDDAAQVAIRERILQAGFPITPVIDRHYFHSLYFRDGNGLLFEIATDLPGFTADGETLETLGTRLQLPPQHEPRRRQIEATLPSLRYTAAPDKS